MVEAEFEIEIVGALLSLDYFGASIVRELEN